ncbi:MAG: SDR family NAD(P)-dependent oxidoreductase [Planctomycetota bacterium]
MTAALVAALSTEEYRVRQVVPSERLRQVTADRFEVDMSSPESVHELHQLLAGSESVPVGSVINLLGLCQPFCRPGCEDPDAPLRLSEWTFNLVKEFEEDLRTSAIEGGGWFVNVTRLDGKFGLVRGENAALAAAGTLGISKSLQRECPRLMVKNVDVDPTLEPHLVAARLIDELSASDDLLEVGLCKQGRWRLDLLRDPAPETLSPLPVDASSVVLITGGAFGVTADVAKALAVSARPTLILVGRSPLPSEESADTRGLQGGALRSRLIEKARAGGGKVLPADIERSLKRIEKNRQILDNIAACRDAGSNVEYHALDVRDGKAFGDLIEDLYSRFGRIDGVVHGAGIIDDKRIRDKSPESFANVLRTKVGSAMTLASKLRPESLKFLVFFSSVSGRFGNAGQSDYSAANEFLNKLADHLDKRWPARVVSINWGPWDGGMVSDDLRKMYATVGFELIPIDEGVRSFLSEIRLAERRSPEVVISCSVERMMSTDPVHA